ncbi:phosphonate ABC transporter ATP-binding protein [Xanthobacter sp. KR7-225]|uniref:phosphonate ABC transporter ATP-binding protein n=1 Tax=Xanthobacter sp. KR7-225 TaxID=3156613 RepID=UPI0032B3BEAE
MTLAAPPASLTAAAAPALKLEAVTKTFGATVALDSVSFAIAPGEVVALLGPSGAGKSTVFRCISRLAEVDGGRVLVLGRDIGGLNRRALRQHRGAIGLIFQQFNLIARMTAVDNALAGRLGQVPTWRAVTRCFSRADRQIALAALDRVGLLEKAYQRADSLSGGQQQRVAIARVLAQRSRLVLADEPVASLDPASAANVLTVLKDIAREHGIAVLCALHQTDLACRYADRIVAMRRGRVVLDAPSAAVTAAQLDAVYYEAGEGPRAAGG